MNRVLFLQNAWSPLYAGGTWPRPSWLRALQASRSGQRLRILIDDFEICENTTPIVGDNPDSVIPPDFKHIMSILETRKPQLIITCGKQAETALLSVWGGPLLALPHPAHRLVTNTLYATGKALLSKPYTQRLALRQKMGYVETIQL